MTSGVPPAVRKPALKRTPMLRGRGAKTKGSVAEAEVVAMLTRIGFEGVRRNFRSGAAGGGDVIGVPDHSIEVKRCETVRVWEWISQAVAAARRSDVAVVVFRRSRSPWFVVLEAEEYFGMVRELQELRAR